MGLRLVSEPSDAFRIGVVVRVLSDGVGAGSGTGSASGVLLDHVERLPGAPRVGDGHVPVLVSRPRREEHDVARIRHLSGRICHAPPCPVERGTGDPSVVGASRERPYRASYVLAVLAREIDALASVRAVVIDALSEPS